MNIETILEQVCSEQVCPITLMIFRNPYIIIPSGITVENCTIEKLEKCPLTGVKIEGFVKNTSLKNFIDDLCKIKPHIELNRYPKKYDQMKILKFTDLFKYEKIPFYKLLEFVDELDSLSNEQLFLLYNRLDDKFPHTNIYEKSLFFMKMGINRIKYFVEKNYRIPYIKIIINILQMNTDNYNDVFEYLVDNFVLVEIKKNKRTRAFEELFFSLSYEHSNKIYEIFDKIVDASMDPFISYDMLIYSWCSCNVEVDETKKLNRIKYFVEEKGAKIRPGMIAIFNGVNCHEIMKYMISKLDKTDEQFSAYGGKLKCYNTSYEKHVDEYNKIYQKSYRG